MSAVQAMWYKRLLLKEKDVLSEVESELSLTLNNPNNPSGSSSSSSGETKGGRDDDDDEKEVVPVQKWKRLNHLLMQLRKVKIYI